MECKIKIQEAIIHIFHEFFSQFKVHFFRKNFFLVTLFQITIFMCVGGTFSFMRYRTFDLSYFCILFLYIIVPQPQVPSPVLQTGSNLKVERAYRATRIVPFAVSPASSSWTDIIFYEVDSIFFLCERRCGFSLRDGCFT